MYNSVKWLQWPYLYTDGNHLPLRVSLRPCDAMFLSLIIIYENVHVAKELVCGVTSRLGRDTLTTFSGSPCQTRGWSSKLSKDTTYCTVKPWLNDWTPITKDWDYNNPVIFAAGERWDRDCIFHRWNSSRPMYQTDPLEMDPSSSIGYRTCLRIQRPALSCPVLCTMRDWLRVGL